MSFNNNPYSYQVGSQRLLSPVNPSTTASYVWNSSGSLGCDATQINATTATSPGTQYYLLNGEEPSVPDQRPPVGGPSAPALLDALQTSLSVAFFGGNVTGRQPITYDLLWGPATPPGRDLNHKGVVAIEGSPGFYAATVTDLTPATDYVFVARAVNRDGIGSSPIATFTTLAVPPPGEGPPTGTITTPLLYGATTATSMAVRFDLGVLTSNPPLTSIQILYGEEPNPGEEGLYLIVTAFLLSGTLYEAYLEGLDRDTDYYVQARVGNPFGQRLSLGAGPFRTQVGSGVPPQGGPFNTPLIAGSAGPTQLTMQSTAQNPISLDAEVYMRYGPAADNLLFYEEAYTVGTGPEVWEAELTQLQAGGSYFVQTVASTGTAPDIVSAIGGPFIAGSGSGAPFGRVSTTTGTYRFPNPAQTIGTLSLAARVANILGNPTPTVSFIYGLSSGVPGSLNVVLPGVQSTVPGEEDVFRASDVLINNLNSISARCYASNSAGQLNGEIGGPFIVQLGPVEPPAPPPPFPV